jgi:hypothetical protein
VQRSLLRRLLVSTGLVLAVGAIVLPVAACHICTPGERHECVYLAGPCKKATQVCNAEGTQWEGCVCQEPATPTK